VARAVRGAVVGDAVGAALRGAVVGEAVETAIAPMVTIGARATFRDTWIGAMLRRLGITGLIDARPACMTVALRE
jgi:hypothetical protein